MAEKVDKGKKRKRLTDNSSKPSKRVAIEEDGLVQVSFHDGDQWAPIIASTPGVSLPTSIPLKPYTKHRRNAPQRVGHSGAIATTEFLLHSAQHPTLDYTAREEESGGVDTLLKHYVGVYDPESGKLEVMEARKMVIRGVVRAHQATAADEIPLNMKDLRNNLGQTFGTKKARQAIAAVTENAIAPGKSARTLENGEAPKLNAAATAVLASMKDQTTGMATKAQLQESVDASKPRPKPNMEAMEIKDVYTIDNLIGEDVMKLIPVRQWQEARKQKKEVRVKSRFVANRIHGVNVSIEKMKVLRYMLLLLEVYMGSMPNRSGRNLPKREVMKSFLGDIPEAVIENVKRKFADGGLISKFKLDLMITHLCAMACVVDNYEVNMWDLKEDLKLETSKMAQYFHEIGAKIRTLPEAEKKRLNLDKVQASQHKVAKLKLPLDFPKIPVGRRQR